MTWNFDDERHPARELHRLLRVQARALQQLEGIRADLESPGTVELLRTLRSRTGSVLPDRIREVVATIEEAIRILKVAESQARVEYTSNPTDFSVEGLPNLPIPLARFVAERADAPGFSYELEQDLVRGWVIRWKEHSADGSVRGSGQFYERPYAWLDE